MSERNKSPYPFIMCIRWHTYKKSKMESRAGKEEEYQQQAGTGRAKAQLAEADTKLKERQKNQSSSHACFGFITQLYITHNISHIIIVSSYLNLS